MGSMSRRQFNAALGSSALLAMSGARAQGSKLTIYAGPPEKTDPDHRAGVRKEKRDQDDVPAACRRARRSIAFVPSGVRRRRASCTASACLRC